MDQATPGECDHFYLEAFDHLKTERQVGMGLGPIPWSAMLLYASIANLDGPNTRNFVIVIRAMDDAYMEWHDKQNEKSGKGQGDRYARGNKTTTPK